MQIDLDAIRLTAGGSVLLDGFTARFASRRVTALVGPSGSGKSTLLAAISGYHRIDAGTIAFHRKDGEEGSAPPDPELVAWVPQGSNALARRTALDNVLVAPLSEGRDLDEARAVATDALTAVGLANRADHPARRLSGGELQRVAFARALASTRPVVLADEPSASLDGANTKHLAELLHGLAPRATMIVATHDPILIDAAQAVVELRPRR